MDNGFTPNANVLLYQQLEIHNFSECIAHPKCFWLLPKKISLLEKKNTIEKFSNAILAYIYFKFPSNSNTGLGERGICQLLNMHDFEAEKHVRNILDKNSLRNQEQRKEWFSKQSPSDIKIMYQSPYTQTIITLPQDVYCTLLEKYGLICPITQELDNAILSCNKIIPLHSTQSIHYQPKVNNGLNALFSGSSELLSTDNLPSLNENSLMQNLATKPYAEISHRDNAVLMEDPGLSFQNNKVATHYPAYRNNQHTNFSGQASNYSKLLTGLPSTSDFSKQPIRSNDFSNIFFPQTPELTHFSGSSALPRTDYPYSLNQVPLMQNLAANPYAEISHRDNAVLMEDPGLPFQDNRFVSRPYPTYHNNQSTNFFEQVSNFSKQPIHFNGFSNTFFSQTPELTQNLLTDRYAGKAFFKCVIINNWPDEKAIQYPLTISRPYIKETLDASGLKKKEVRKKFYDAIAAYIIAHPEHGETNLGIKFGLPNIQKFMNLNPSAFHNRKAREEFAERNKDTFFWYKENPISHEAYAWAIDRYGLFYKEAINLKEFEQENLKKATNTQ